MHVPNYTWYHYSGTVDAIGKLQVKMQVAATYRTKHLISTAILATLFLIAGEFSDADPDGRHFNYLAFHVMRLISKSF
jgi:hypothetical protein